MQVKLQNILYSTGHSCTICFAVLLALHRFYCFISNISATPPFSLHYVVLYVFLNNIAPNNTHYTCSLCHLRVWEGLLTGRDVWPGVFYPGGFWPRWQKTGASDRGQYWPGGFERTPTVQPATADDGYVRPLCLKNRAFFYVKRATASTWSRKMTSLRH